MILSSISGDWSVETITRLVLADLFHVGITPRVRIDTLGRGLQSSRVVRVRCIRRLDKRVDRHVISSQKLESTSKPVVFNS